MATQGPLYPGTVATEIGPSGDDNWTSPGNVSADDGAEAQVTAASFDSGDHTYRLKATNFGFSIPAGATIDGIVVEIERRCFAGSAADQEVQLYNASGALVGTNKATATAWPSTIAIATYGGAADTWTASPTVAMVNDVDFGVALIARATAANVDIGVDFIRITVHYTPAPGPVDGAIAINGTGSLGLTGDVVGPGGVTTYIDDDFDARSPLSDSLGSAPVGGDYTNDGTFTDIVGGRAIITHTAALNSTPRLLSATFAQDQDYKIKVNLPALPTGAEIQIRYAVRLNATTTYYRCATDVQTDGSVIIEAHSLVANVAGTNLFSFTIPSFTWVAGTDYWVRVQAEGVSPTTIRMKIWDASGSEPGTWTAEGTDSTAALQADGSAGFIMRSTSSITNFPFVSEWDDWTVTSIATGGSNPVDGAIAIGATGALGLTGGRTMGTSVAIGATGALALAGGKLAAGTVAIAGSGQLGLGGSRLAAGAIAVAGTGQVGLLGGKLQSGAVSIDATGSVVLTGSRAISGAIAVGATGQLGLTGRALFGGTLTISGTGSIVETGSKLAGATAAINGSGTLVLGGGKLHAASVAINGSGSIALTPTARFGGSLAIDGVGSLSLSTAGVADGSIAITGTGGLQATGSAIRGASASVTGTGALGLSGGLLKAGSVALNGAGQLGATGGALKGGSLAIAGIGSITLGGSARLSGTMAAGAIGSLSLNGSVSGSGASVDIGAAGSLSLSGSVVKGGAIGVSGSGSVTAAGSKVIAGSLSLAGTGQATLGGSRWLGSELSIGGTGSVSLGSGLAVFGYLGIFGEGDLSMAATGAYDPLDPTAHASVTLGGLSGTVRLVETAVRLIETSAKVRLT